MEDREVLPPLEDINALAYAVAPSRDDEEEEERESLREEQQGYTWVGSERMVRLPHLDPYGNPVFLDVRRWIPAGDVFDTGMSQSAMPIPPGVQPGGPLMIGAELALNKSAFTGDPIANPLTDTAGERARKALGHFYKSVMPNAPWVPGSWSQERSSGRTEADFSGGRRLPTARPIHGFDRWASRSSRKTSMSASHPTASISTRRSASCGSSSRHSRSDTPGSL